MRIRFAQLRLSWFRIIVVAGPKRTRLQRCRDNTLAPPSGNGEKFLTLSQSHGRLTQETPASSQGQLSKMKLDWACDETHEVMTEAGHGFCCRVVPTDAFHVSSY